jgi:phosphatidylglycerophosphatase A
MKQQAAPSSIWTNPIHFFAFGLGSGALPWVPGTWGTLAAVPLYLLLRLLPLWLYVLVVLLAIAGGIYICSRTEHDIGVHDHSGIVWDEMCGYWVTMLAAPSGNGWLMVGFVLFRIFDIWKPWPIRWIDKKIAGGWGIMLDDLLAAIYAWVILQLMVKFV